jgi:hypothetical protein
MHNVKCRTGNMTMEKTRIESGKNLNTRKLIKQLRRKDEQVSQQPAVKICFQYKLQIFPFIRLAVFMCPQLAFCILNSHFFGCASGIQQDSSDRMCPLTVFCQLRVCFTISYIPLVFVLWICF